MIRPAPREGREATPHWQAACEGILLLPFCSLTGRPVWPPTAACEAAGGVLEWRRCTGGGTVAGFSVVRRAVQPEWKQRAPYVVAMVDLDAGVRMFGNIVDCDPTDVSVGARVSATYVPTTAPGLGVVVFRLGRTACGSG